MKKKSKLSKEEQELEKALEQGDWQEAPAKEKKQLVQSAKEFTKTKKTKTVNLRMTEQDVELLKKRAQKEGLPYQTLLASIAHKYASGQLVDIETVDVIVSKVLKKSKVG